MEDIATLLSVPQGGGKCFGNTDCGGIAAHTQGTEVVYRGLCKHNICVCNPNYTGPNCLVMTSLICKKIILIAAQSHNGYFDDEDVDSSEWSVVLRLYMPITLSAILLALVVANVLIIRTRYKENFIRGPWRYLNFNQDDQLLRIRDVTSAKEYFFNRCLYLASRKHFSWHVAFREHYRV